MSNRVQAPAIATAALGALLVAACERPVQPCRGATVTTAAAPLPRPAPLATAPVPGTVAAGQTIDDDASDEDGSDERREFLPFELTEQRLARGRQRFDLFCAVCHGSVGDGISPVAKAGLQPPPPSFHRDDLRQQPVGHFFAIATRGTAHMPALATAIAAEDRWAIAAYLRALQLSQDSEVANIPTAVRIDQGWEQ